MTCAILAPAAFRGRIRSDVIGRAGGSVLGNTIAKSQERDNRSNREEGLGGNNIFDTTGVRES